MVDDYLRALGNNISRLRIANNLKQSELAYEAGISERTLQRLEAGEPVKSDGLMRVIKHLGRLEQLLAAIEAPALSPYELANSPASGRARKRVTGSSDVAEKPPGKILWPEDQQ